MLRFSNLKVKDTSTKRMLLTVPDICFEDGQCHVVLGRTGAGKSMLTRTLSGFHTPGLQMSGRLKPAGGDWQNIDPTRQLWRRTVFLIPQDPMVLLDPTMSVGRQVAEILRWRSFGAVRNDGLEALAASLGLLTEDLSKLPHACSGGMLQRVLIAMALAARADLLVLDEPTKGLDQNRLEESLSLLARLKQSRRALCVVTHDLQLARGLGDTITVLDKGRVAEQGRAMPLLERPGSTALRNLILSEPDHWTRSPQRCIGKPVVSLEKAGLYLRAERRWLFRRLSLEISSGEIVGLTGNSGVGKTTLADLLLGLTPPAEGQVYWYGKQLTAYSKRDRRRNRPDFLKLFQDPVATLPPNLPARFVLEHLTPHRDLRFVGPAGQARLLERLHLAQNVLDRRVQDLSGGEAQRLAIARMIMARPAFLVCDEPSSRLDMSVQKDTVDLLLEWVRETGAALFFIAHDRRILEAIADRSLLLTEAGRLKPLFRATVGK